MSDRPIIDAGPSLNFLSIRRERLLIDVLGPLSAPETVEAEVLRKSRQDERFSAAEATWRKLTPKWVQILSDDPTPELAVVIHRISSQPMEQRLQVPKDLGELMVIAHAVVAAEAGEAVTILIDDGSGARIAAAEIRRLDRLRAANQRRGIDQSREHADRPGTSGGQEAHSGQSRDARDLRSASRPRRRLAAHRDDPTPATYPLVLTSPEQPSADPGRPAGRRR